MPPIPPRRTLRSMFVPRDATETARQGQGIGDLEAMRQMATTAIPEVLRNAPATSTAMSAFDTARALSNRDYGNAGLAALGMVPFAGMIDDVGKQAAKHLPKVAESFPRVGNALDAIKQLAADMAEETAMLRKDWAAKGQPFPERMSTEDIRKQLDAHRVVADRRGVKLGAELDAATQRVNQAKVAHQEATAYRRAVMNDPNSPFMEYDLAKKKERELKQAWLDAMEQRRNVWSNNPYPKIEP